MKRIIFSLMLLGSIGYTAARITNVDIASNAGISFSKLAALSSGKLLVGNVSNVATAVTPAGEVTMDNVGSFGLSNAAVIAKVLSGYTSGAGTVAASDSILQAIQKLNGNDANLQPLDGDLTAIAALAGTNTIYYRSGANTWTAVTVSADLTFSGGVLSITNPVTSALSASNIDWSVVRANGGLYTKTLGAATTITFSNKTSGQTILVRLTNTNSNWTVTWPTVKWANGSAPTMSTGVSADIYTFVYDGTDVFGSYVQKLY